MRSVRLSFAAAVVGLLGSLLVASAPAGAADPVPGPTGLQVTGTSSTIIKLSWSPVTDASAYVVAYSKESDFDPGAEMATTATSVSISGLTKQTTYYVRVKATAEGQDLTGWSEAITAKTGPILMRVGSFNVKDPDTEPADGPCKLWNSGRKALVAKDVVDSKVDVLGLQELYDTQDRTSFMAALRLAGGGKYLMTPDLEDSDAGWDNRLLYDTERVTLINSTAVPFNTQDGDGSDRQFVWGTFELKSNRHRFLVYTTHLEPGGSATLKKAQWEHIRANAVENGVKKNLPVFITGDFNTSKFDSQSSTVLGRMKSSGFGDVLGQTYKSYKVSGQRAKTKTYAYFNSYNGCNTRPSRVDKANIGNNVDWIFATNSLQIPAWRTWVHLNGSAAASSIPSDHWMLTIQALLP
jgi:endonuclease/exonuclease/phosphatase family metal-dependent hydrolase